MPTMRKANPGPVQILPRLRLCSDAISEIDREMQNIYQGKDAEYEEHVQPQPEAATT